MRVLVITSCTGEKAVEHERQLTLADFQKGPEHVGQREAELADLMLPAEELYTGQQHVRLMRGVKQFRERNAGQLDLFVLSAGYGLVPGERKLAPYEATFAGMSKKELRRWADALDVPAQVRRVLAEPYDLALILLGDAYLEAWAPTSNTLFGGPTLLLCGSNMAGRMPKWDSVSVLPLTNQDAKRFSCGLVGLKGELATKILGFAQEHNSIAGSDLVTRLYASELYVPSGASSQGASANVDRVISLPAEWWNLPHRSRLRYFIPEWDDLVDPNFDFETDTHSGGSGDWSNEVFAHQMFDSPNYDGLLVSKVVAFKSKRKEQRIKSMGIHRYLRVPPDFPVMGDCGAFGYITQENPPYTTDEILNYYTEVGFDYGVSIDHLIVSATEGSRQHRYQLTLHNADEFLREHRKRQLPWEPIGAVQGWDPVSYAEGARQCVAMGYRYIGLGGLVRTSTTEIVRVLEEVHKYVPSDVSIHLFGLARLGALRTLSELGVRSVDSASLLRRAWLGTGENYLTASGELFAAIRIPEVGKSFRAKRMVSEGRISVDRAEALERAANEALLLYDRGKVNVDTVVEIVSELDRLITPDRPDNTELLRATLLEMPWKHCPCEICRKDGVQVIIFRGNNRNRRRGFHNTYVFYRLLQRVLAGENISIRKAKRPLGHQQLSLFDGTDSID